MNCAAFATYLGRWLEAGIDDQFGTVPISFVRQLPSYFTERHISQRPGYTAVSHHPFHIQIFDSDQVIIQNKFCRKLVNRIVPNTGDSMMSLG